MLGQVLIRGLDKLGIVGYVGVDIVTNILAQGLNPIWIDRKVFGKTKVFGNFLEWNVRPVGVRENGFYVVVGKVILHLGDGDLGSGFGEY